MSLHYIIDGYNVVKQVSPWLDMALEEARKSFLEFIQDKQLAGSLRNKITVVFDGRDDVFYLPAYSDDTPLIRIIFSKGETADDVILKILNNSSNPKNIVVVSDDRALSLSARSSGAQLMQVKEFLAKSDKHRGDSINHSDHKLSVLQEKQINEELRKIWLKEKK